MMVWQTQLGERVLEGVEAEFYVEALHSAVDDLELSEDVEVEPAWRTGDRIFDTASFNQKLVLLHTCLEVLLNPEIPAPTLTNVWKQPTTRRLPSFFTVILRKNPLAGFTSHLRSKHVY